MKLTPEQILHNWNEFLEYIETYISEPRKEKLLLFYKSYEDRIILYPAANKKEYHSAFPGGYIYHVNNVIKGSMALYKVWESFGCDMTTFTYEELIFSSINHDLGKIGDESNASYIPQTDQWRKDKLGEDYMFNNKVSFASVPDRSLFLLQSNNIPYTFNEMLAIQTHDRLYDEANKKYLMGWNAETKPRTSIPFILHQADLMAARIEFEMEWLPKLNKDSSNSNLEPSSISPTLDKKKTPMKSKALGSIKSQGLKDIFDSI